MRDLKKLLPFVAIIFFALGVGSRLWWGEHVRQRMAYATPLRLLCAEGWLSSERLEAFSAKHHVPIQHFTYANPTEMLRQLANSDGKIDVVCSPSSLIRSLARNQWIRKYPYREMSQARALAIDFLQLPYDQNSEYSVPIFWDLYGFFGRPERLEVTTKQLLQTKKVGLWNDDLNLSQLMVLANLKGKPDTLLKNAARRIPVQAEAGSPDKLLNGLDWAQVPLNRVSAWLNESYHFVLPEEGSSLILGTLAIGDKASQPDLAAKLINDLISTEHALEVHKRLHTGVVHRTLDNDENIPAWLRPQGLRRFALTRIKFPDIEIESLLGSEKSMAQEADERSKKSSDGEE